MSGYTVDPRDLGKYERKLKRSFVPMMSRGMKVASETLVERLKMKSVLLVRPYRGQFNAGWATKRIDWLTRAVFNRAKHSPFVEGGRAPGGAPPPVSALEPWVQKVMGIPAPESRRVAFLIARKIGRRGIAARPVLRGSEREMGVYFQQALVKVFDQWLQQKA